MKDNMTQMYLDNCWNANLSITGAEGLPPMASAGNVVRAFTGIRLSLRTPPPADPEVMIAALKEKVMKDVPYNAKIEIKNEFGAPGWLMRDLEPWFLEAIRKTGADFCDGKPTGSYGEGGSIPFLK